MEHFQSSSSSMEDQPPKKIPTVQISKYFYNQHSLLPFLSLWCHSPSQRVLDLVNVQRNFMGSIWPFGWSFLYSIAVFDRLNRFMEIVNRHCPSSVSFCEVSIKILTFYCPLPASLADKTGTLLWVFGFVFEFFSCLSYGFVFDDYGVWMSMNVSVISTRLKGRWQYWFLWLHYYGFESLTLWFF